VVFLSPPYPAWPHIQPVPTNLIQPLFLKLYCFSFGITIFSLSVWTRQPRGFSFFYPLFLRVYLWVWVAVFVGQAGRNGCVCMCVCVRRCVCVCVCVSVLVNEVRHPKSAHRSLCFAKKVLYFNKRSLNIIELKLHYIALVGNRIQYITIQ
jgi:hypothetical protein